MQTLAWATDVHLNFLSPERIDAFADALVTSRPDAVLISGDISEGDRLTDDLLRLAARVACPIHFVLGNHDYYRRSIGDVRAEVAELTAREPKLRWLHGGGVVRLDARHALVGCDGWGDARAGDVEGTEVFLSDFLVIRELAGLRREALVDRLRKLGDESAEVLRDPLRRALEGYEEVFVLTHVPPFVEACWHEGRISDDDWLPYFTSIAVGDVILREARRHPTRRITVLCGHTHGAGFARVAPNVEVRTGGADYGHPHLQPLIMIGE